jgi:hypothetical protein
MTPLQILSRRCALALGALLLAAACDQPVGIQRSFLLAGDSVAQEGLSTIAGVAASPDIRSSRRPTADSRSVTRTPSGWDSSPP